MPFERLYILCYINVCTKTLFFFYLKFLEFVKWTSNTNFSPSTILKNMCFTSKFEKNLRNGQPLGNAFHFIILMLRRYYVETKRPTPPDRKFWPFKCPLVYRLLWPLVPHLTLSSSIHSHLSGHYVQIQLITGICLTLYNQK